MKPSSLKFMDVVETSMAPRAPLAVPASGRPLRERCDVSSIDPADPLAKPAPAEQVFRRPPDKSAPLDAAAKKKLSPPGARAADARTVVGHFAPGNDDTGAIEPKPNQPATLKISLQAQIDILGQLAASNPNALQAAVQILQNHFRWNGTLKFEPPEHQLPSHGAAGELRAVVTAPAPGNSSGSSTANVGSLALETTNRSARVSEQLRQAAAWLSAVITMARQHENLRKLADTDELSGAFNRRYFMQAVPEILNRARRERFCISLLLFDIDDFKHYNDHFGHAAGDAIIREVINLLRRCTRTKDLVARIGGDEFAVVFGDDSSLRQPDSQHPRTVFAMAQRFRKAVADHPWNSEGGPIAGKLSISGGLATFPWDAQGLNELMAVADAELLKAKSMGKNAIVLANPQADEA